MSDLRYKSVEELQGLRKHCKNLIRDHSQIVSGQKERLEWIEKYLHEKTPVEMSMQEIEQKLGHKVILK